ncbi:hypothetical protein [Flectobacillus sp. BAB-3569]|uniref:hypothetical protein n=1 Tax=Flectobacillus sp. BAB-3569 TaxID=1509483 RepID=UPI000BA435D5|nr:hypothetical protein [Flectobacillus sp. BAB-3569]PAC29273.1 hypothetical protein BWI92_16735 [Flectobacillus sp. BAB-3569]
MVFVFKTNISNRWQTRRLRKQFEEQLQVSYSSFDLEDCDKVLRIESSFEVTNQVIQLMQENGFSCEELVD